MEVGRQKLGHWVRVLGADYPLIDITPGAVDEYVKQRRGEDVTDHTISKELTHLKSVLRLAKRSGCYPHDIATLSPDDLRPGYVPRKRALNRQELLALLSVLEPHRAAVVAICVALGVRWGEAMRLIPSDIGTETAMIRGTKTAGARRTVPILSLYRPLLDAAVPYLPLEPWGNVGRDLGRACARAGIERCTPNDLRRTHATLLVEAGVDRDVVRRLLGHTTTTMVDRVYGQPSPDALGQLAEERLERAPSLAVQIRHSGEAPIADPGASSGIRTPDLRFTKPVQAPGGSGQKSRIGCNSAPPTSVSVGEPPRDSAGVGTDPSQCDDLPAALVRALRAVPPPEVEDLALAYRSALAGDEPATLTALARCAAHILEGRRAG